jgi:hypothetical protein
MANLKKVYFSKVEVIGNVSFDNILRNASYRKVIEYNDKLVELSHIDVDEHYIRGLFVSTQDAGIAPIHKPGDDEDYSAVTIPNGKGFAYPNAFIYLRELNVLIWEANRMGLSEVGMSYYFETVSGLILSNIKVHFHPILNFNPTLRINKLLEINKIELQIAEPTELLKKSAKDGFFSQVAKLANSSNATKSMSITLVANEERKEKLSKVNILDLLKGFLPIQSYAHGRVKNKMIVVGKTRNEQGLVVEEIVNIVLNRFESSFNLVKLRIAPHLQITERKEGITLVAVTRFDEIKKLI